jgi:hypothetical protein
LAHSPRLRTTLHGLAWVPLASAAGELVMGGH